MRGARPDPGCTGGSQQAGAAFSSWELIGDGMRQLLLFGHVSSWILLSNSEESLNDEFNLKIKL